MSFEPPAPPYLGPASKTSGKGNKPIRRIVLHGTVSPTVIGGARSIAKYFKGDSAGGSAHYIVDPGEVVQSAYDDVICWHAPPNHNSIGIEMCDMVGGSRGALPMSRWDDNDHRAMLHRAAKLTAELCLAYDIPPVLLSPRGLRADRRGICEHSDVSEAWGQSSHWDLGNFPRRQFITLVRRQIALIREQAQPNPVATPPVKATRIDKARDLLRGALADSVNATRKNKIQRSLDNLPKH